MKQQLSFGISLLFKRGIFCLLLLFAFTIARAQSYHDSTQRKNIIKFDLTSMAFYNNAMNFTYERILKKNRTLGITGGYQELPTLLSLITNDSIKTGRVTASGFKFAVDYRFYLGKENKYHAPHGVYLGPYVAYHHFENDWDLTIKSDNGPQTGAVNGKFDIVNLGFQTGYQFLINNRWSIDLSFIGVSFSKYRAKMDVTGNFDLDESQINQDLLDALTSKFPLFEDLITDGKVDESGSLDSWGFGYRYLVNVGYAFGGGSAKKKAKNL